MWNWYKPTHLLGWTICYCISHTVSVVSKEVCIYCTLKFLFLVIPLEYPYYYIFLSRLYLSWISYKWFFSFLCVRNSSIAWTLSSFCCLLFLSHLYHTWHEIWLSQSTIHELSVITIEETRALSSRFLMGKKKGGDSEVRWAGVLRS